MNAALLPSNLCPHEPCETDEDVVCFKCGLVLGPVYRENRIQHSNVDSPPLPKSSLSQQKYEKKQIKNVLEQACQNLHLPADFVQSALKYIKRCGKMGSWDETACFYLHALSHRYGLYRGFLQCCSETNVSTRRMNKLFRQNASLFSKISDASQPKSADYGGLIGNLCSSFQISGEEEMRLRRMLEELDRLADLSAVSPWTKIHAIVFRHLQQTRDMSLKVYCSHTQARRCSISRFIARLKPIYDVCK